MKSFALLILAVPLAAQNWPSFRGPSASGVADGQNLPAAWNPATGTNIRWKTPIPGLAHSSPIIWGKRVFVTSAISSRGNATFKPGLYGDGTASDDLSPQKWQILCLDLDSGRILWQRTAFEGIPKEKRHIKSTYANATPATDGQVVVAWFGSQGLYAYDINGALLWKQDLGRLDVGAYDAPDYEWGHASSPILFNDSVIVQCDQQKGSFLAAFNLRTGKPLWRTDRDELPSWGTPAIYRDAKRTLLVTNSSNFIHAYDPGTGKEIWRIGGSSKITAPTPVSSPGIILVASGRRPEAPIFAIRPNGEVIWQKQQRGPYMPTPLIYQDLLYVLGNAGIFDCYRLASGEEVYRQRIAHHGSGFSASPVAADGRIYLLSEDGDIFVIRAGAQYELLSAIEIGEPIMASPAIANGLLLIRSQSHLYAIGAPRP